RGAPATAWTPPLPQKTQGRPVARPAPDGVCKRDETPRLCVPENSGTGEAPAARHDPCLAKTRRILLLISLSAERPDTGCPRESNIMKPSPGGCKPRPDISARGPAPGRASGHG